jgi:sugar phosphate isomerase/epimerase
MSGKIKYGLAISEEFLGQEAPVLFHGNLSASMARAATMGFDCVELHIRNPKSLDPAMLQRAVLRHGIQVAALGTGLEYTRNHLSLTSPEREVRHRMISRFCEHIDLASALNAVVFVGMCRGKASSYEERDECLKRLEDSLNPVVEYARTKGVILGLEPIAFYLTNLLNTTEETLHFADRVRSDSLQLLLDTHHMCIEDQSIEDSFRMCKGRIAHVHISDSNRRSPGSGNIDYVKVGSVLREVDYDHTASLEILPYPNENIAAQYGLTQMRKHL